MMVVNVFDRDALSDLAIHFLNKMKIMVLKDIEREEIEFICKVHERQLYDLYVSSPVVYPVKKGSCLRV